jgi:uncharacterized membrane protein
MVGMIDDRMLQAGFTALILSASIMALLPQCAAQAGPRVGPTGRVRILYMGDGWGPSPVANFKTDPSFQIVSVPASDAHAGHGVQAISKDEMRKFVRIYMPRAYSALVSDYDYIVLSDANRGYFGKELQWMRRSVEEEGLGIIMVGGYESFGGVGNPSWANTDVAEILPVTMDEPIEYGFAYKVRPAIDHPFTRALPWETIPVFFDINHVVLRFGATLLLTNDVHPYPHLSYWEVGEGASLAHGTDWTPGGGTLVMRWKYFPDYVANIAFLAVGHSIPENPQLIHRLRSRFFGLTSSMSVSISVVAFAEKFGASATSLNEEIAQVQVMKRQAEQLYIDHMYEESEALADKIDQRLGELRNAAMRLKDQALLWVYVVEWLSVTSVSMVSLYVLWTIMVRRRLYRDVATTRSTGR